MAGWIQWRQGQHHGCNTLRRLLAKVEEYSESHRAHGLPDDLLNILKDDLAIQEAKAKHS